jgi:hypothetical protein
MTGNALFHTWSKSLDAVHYCWHYEKMWHHGKMLDPENPGQIPFFNIADFSDAEALGAKAASGRFV